MSVSTDVDIWRMSVGSVPKEEEMRELVRTSMVERDTLNEVR